MDYIGLIIILVVIAAVWNSAYKSGKHEGSRKGYGVGYDRGKRSRNGTGCLIFLAGLGITLACLASSRPESGSALQSSNLTPDDVLVAPQWRARALIEIGETEPAMGQFGERAGLAH